MFRQHLSWWHLSISGISQLLLTQFWWNFKGSFLGTSRTDSNYQVNICLGNICPDQICPHQKYLSCYWPNFDETLNVASSKHLEQILTIKLTFVQATFVLATFVHMRNIWEHLEQIPSIKLTFVQATFFLETFVHIRNISTVTDPILMKL